MIYCTLHTVPETTPEFTRARLRGYGVEVVVHGKQ
jgi:threonine dehydratase